VAEGARAGWRSGRQKNDAPRKFFVGHRKRCCRWFESNWGSQEKALANASAFFSYIRLAASDIAKGSDIMLRIVLLFLRTLCEYNITAPTAQ